MHTYVSAANFRDRKGAAYLHRLVSDGCCHALREYVWRGRGEVP